MIEIRKMQPGEGVRLCELSEVVGWNHTLPDCEFLVDAPWVQMICAVENNQIVGTAGMPVYGENEMGFINLVIVHPDFRKRGIASAMVKHLLETNPQLRTFRLHATPAGSFVYTKLGFETTRSMSYLAGERPDFGPAPENVRPAAENDLAALVELDAQNFGLERRELFADNLRRYGKFALKIETDGKLRGFCLGRKGRKYRQFATLETDSGDPETAFALLAAAAPLDSMASNLILFDTDKTAIARAERAGMTKVRELIEMELGAPGTPPAAGYHAIFGGDFG